MDNNSMPVTPQEISKFGFGYDSLTQNIEELELATDDPQAESMFQKAKDLHTWQNDSEAEKILKQMLDSGEIIYKQFSAFGSDIFMNSFGAM